MKNVKQTLIASYKVGNPKYILDLLLSAINVSRQTAGIVEGLPGEILIRKIIK